MAELWYYTNEGKQMDAVTMKELKRLVGDGTLKPTDMVWKEGMARWIRASSVKELFPDPGAALDKFFTSASSSGVVPPPEKPPGNTSVAAGKPGAVAPAAEAVSEKSSAPAPVEKKKSKSSADEEPDERRPPRKRAEASSGGGGGGMIMILALVAGGALLFLGLIVAVVIMLFAFSGGDRKPGGNVAQDRKDAPIDNKDGGNIQPGQEIKGEVRYVAAVGKSGTHSQTFKFQKDVAYDLRVTSEPRHPDVDLYVMKGAQPVISDSSVGPDSRILWTPREDGEYRVEVRNLNPATNVQSTVTITESAEPPLPKGVLAGRGSTQRKSPKVGTVDLKFQVRGGYPAKLTANTPGVSITVIRDSDNAQIAAHPANAGALQFSVPKTEVVTARFRSEGKSSVTITVIYDVSP
jgi:hypothetical protein